ncbi:DUF2515 domain-containing protein [Bacillus sp. DNRA2]|nr:DUF2515 domain-containing protein [Bacillus sp. DNRA2]NMD70355.1 DUF2515 domain-containing protein [Bacillus sp. DNRA2]
MQLSSYKLSLEEEYCLRKIKADTEKWNVDNISRTKAYFSFFEKYPEISWAFLASMVSRNGGWNMCDLEGKWFPHALPKQLRSLLFLTYERANWIIFQDAYPQLLLYHYSTKMRRSMFHLLRFFCVSSFMEVEWKNYWLNRDGNRLVTSLIINEQNVIQKPVIEHPVFKKKVFHSLSYFFQDWFHFSSVIFPTVSGELFGASVSGFTKLSNRIDLGKRLANILLSPNLYPYFFQFAKKTEHTGSRMDYEQYLYLGQKRQRETPFLRTTYPIISHLLHEKKDWSKEGRVKKAWYKPIRHKHPILLTDWYLKKQSQMKTLIGIEELIK